MRLPHGFFDGGLVDICPSITTSSFEFNNLLIEKKKIKDMEVTQKDLFSDMDLVDESLIDFSCMENEEFEDGRLELPPELIGKKIRIRKLTEREVFRLMGVDDADIDKIRAARISMTGQYHLAGNSIVVDVLFHLFRKLFIETEADIEPGEQMSLF